MNEREPNADFLRAMAISLVLIHHTGQYLLLLPDSFRSFLHLGVYGVDLFFVLSGWLIGRLYWRESVAFGNVDVPRFLVRRWLRTVPPYLAVLPVAYLSVYWTRGEPFDWRYLAFLQNYEHRMPFYLVSWSLCVEEHFYLTLPIVLACFSTLHVAPTVALPVLAMLSTALRFVDPNAGPGTPFGYADAATHLRLEGLALGVLMAYLSLARPDTWKWIQRRARFAVGLLIGGMLTIPYWSSWAAYCLGYTYVSITWAALLASLVGSRGFFLARYRVTEIVALTSYSIYLTHSLVLHACVMVADQIGVPREALWLVWMLIVLGVGMVAYQLVERPVLGFRDRIVPRRAMRQAA